jgi:hypothetical protein
MISISITNPPCSSTIPTEVFIPEFRVDLWRMIFGHDVVTELTHTAWFLHLNRQQLVSLCVESGDL